MMRHGDSSALETCPLSIELQRTPLHALHQELGGRMVAFAGFELPVQYPAGLMTEHRHTRASASLFDVSHMGQLFISGAGASLAMESLMPVDVLGLGVGRQRYGMLLTDEGGIIDDLMFLRLAAPDDGDRIFMVVNGACKVGDIAHMQARIGSRCHIEPQPDRALLALQGPKAVDALARLAPGVEKLVFMTGGEFQVAGLSCILTRSGYTGEDGYEISVAAQDAEALARALLAQPEVQAAGLGARNSLRLEAGLCLYGNDMDTSATPVEASLAWAIQKVRRTGGARAGGFPGAERILAQLDHPSTLPRQRVGLVALERIPVREHTELQDASGQRVGEVTSGLLAPSLDQAVAMAYVPPALSAVGTRVNAIVRGKAVPMEVTAMPFVAPRYFRG
jgi:aminomethyltransferase